MPLLKTYDLFISHPWSYNSEYYPLVDLLRQAPNFKWRNYSVPEHDPVLDPTKESGKKALRAELEGQIRPVNCVLIIGGMYVPHSDWILDEIGFAQKYGKPIIGIKPRGAQVMPRAVSGLADTIVGWTTESIVSAIRKHAL